MQPPVAVHTLCEMYQQGMPINALAKAFSIPYTRARRILIDHNVRIAKRGPRKNSPYRTLSPLAKMTLEEKDDLVKCLHEATHSFSELAKIFHVSRERVRQIAVAHKAPTGRKRLEMRHKVHAKEESARAFQRTKDGAARHFRRYEEWRRLWKMGKRIRDIAELTNHSVKGVGVRITALRHKHPDWFPYRRLRCSGSCSASAELLLRLGALWSLRVPRVEIARELKISESRLKSILNAERRINPERVPFRRRVRPPECNAGPVVALP